MEEYLDNFIDYGLLYEYNNSMSHDFERILDITLPQGKSAFLWGPRKVGKTFWIHSHLKDFVLIDFLKTDVFADYASRPYLLRERYQSESRLIVIDEVQMVPDILNEVHWLIENTDVSFLLTGSSPRKLRVAHANLLGGRAWRFTMTPLCFPEIENVDIQKAVISGLLPSHYNAADRLQELRAYIADYLKEEIASWSVTQNIPAFSEFLRVAALMNGELLNYTNVARESGVSVKLVRQYFQILEDTLLGYRVQPWRKAYSRRLVETEKFYFFDVGVSNYLARREPKVGTPEFGKSFEHFILMELKSYQAYMDPELPISFWRTSNGAEVDFILGDMEVAIEIKSSKRVHSKDAKGLRMLQEETKVGRSILISFEQEPKQMEASGAPIECMFWKDFLTLLWDKKIL